jgi:hypothetical protein
MMRPAPLRFSLFLTFLALSVGQALGAEKSALELLPPSTLAYLEVPAPGAVFDLALDHPLMRKIEAVPEFREALARPEWQRVEKVLAHFERTLAMDRRQAARSLTSGGLYVGFDLPSQGVVALVQTADEKLAAKTRDTVIELIRADAKAKGRPDPVEEDELRGVKVAEVNKLLLAAVGKWLFVTNKRLLAFLVLENYFGTGGDSLAKNTQFQTVRAARPGAPAAWAYVDLRIPRQMGALAAAAKKKSNNPALELLAGGVIGLLPDASYATAALDLDATRIKLTATLPGDASQIAKAREFYFARDGKGGAPPLLAPPGTLLTLSTWRDFGSFWRHAPDLFDDRINARMTEAEGKLTTFFAGRNFRDDILGNLEPGLEIVVARQEFPPGEITPAIKLPAVGAVFRLKQPEATSRVFKVTFQSFVGFLNIVGGMKKIEPLELNMEQSGETLVVSTRYLPSPESEAAARRGEAGLHFNASPTAIFSQDRFILASAQPLARQLADLAEKGLSPAEELNSQLVASGPAIQQSLADNRETLVSRNMLTKGHSRPAAEQEIDGLLALANHLHGLALSLATHDQELRLSLELSLAAGQ